MHTYKVTFDNNSKLFIESEDFTKVVHDMEHYVSSKMIEDSILLSIVSIVRV